MQKQIDVTGGTARALPDVAAGFGASRSADDLRLVAPANAAAIVLEPAGGGARADATRIVPSQAGHRFPHFLPDGRHFLFLATGTSAVQGIYLCTRGLLEAKRRPCRHRG